MRKRSLTTLLLVTMLTAHLPWSTAVHAATAEEKASSSKALTQGLELRAKGDFAAALEKIKAAYAFATTPVTAHELGLALRDVGLLIEARAKLMETIGMPKGETEGPASAKARADAQTDLAALEPRIPLVVLEIEGGAPSNVIATLDGVEVKPATLGFERAINPGKHVFAARVGTGAESTTSFQVAEHEKRKVTLKVEVAKTEPAKTEPAKTEPAKTEPAKTEPAKAEPAKTEPVKADVPPPKSSSSLGTVGLVAGIGGVVLAGVGGVVFLGGRSSYADAQAQCTAGVCPSAAIDQADAANGREKLGVGLLIGGGVLAVGGAVLWLTSGSAPSSGTSVAIGPTGFTLRGSF